MALEQRRISNLSDKILDFIIPFSFRKVKNATAGNLIMIGHKHKAYCHNSQNIEAFCRKRACYKKSDYIVSKVAL